MMPIRVPSHLDPLRIRARLGRLEWTPPRTYGADGWRFHHRSDGRIILVSTAPYPALGHPCDAAPTSHTWVHASVSRRDRVPYYSDLTTMRDAVFGNGWSYQVFPPPSDHVNIHEHCLHLFGRLDGAAALPDFTMGTGSI